jgi:hypothetical protein
MAPNPPAGAAIDYFVKGRVSGPLALSIFDAQDTLVRRYASDDTPKPADLAQIRVGPEWVVPPSTPATAPGMHRFYWSLRHAADSADEDDGAGEGVWAPPGRYRVELSVNGQRLSQPLSVVPDPRVELPADAYAQQFALARRIAGWKAKVAAAEAEAAKLHKALTERAARAGAALGKQMSDLDRELVAAAGILPRGPSWTAVFEGRKGSLRWYGDKLRGFEAAVDGADATPTVRLEVALPLLEQRLSDDLHRWHALETKAKRLLK